jgi:hypothetical protein
MPKYLQPAKRRGGSISQRLLAKTWQFPSLFSEGPHFCSHLLTVKGAVKNFFDAQRLFSYFYSFQPYHFLPDSNWCDSPFIGKAGRSRRANRQSGAHFQHQYRNFADFFFFTALCLLVHQPDQIS